MAMRSLLVAAALIAASCAKTQSVSECATEQWHGECQLLRITKVEDREFPIPHVVLEATYRPLPNAAHPHHTPGALAQRTLVKSALELPLYDYIEAHPRVACSTQAPVAPACAAPTVALALSPFDPEGAERAQAAPAVTGCAQIESSTSQDAVREAQATKTLIRERIVFGAHSAELPPEAAEQVAQIVELFRARPGIECLGVVGQIASGESPSLAEQRAKVVRELLVTQGVPLTRLLTIGATAKVFGVGARPAEPDPTDRRVNFSVLLERAPAP